MTIMDGSGNRLDVRQQQQQQQSQHQQQQQQQQSQQKPPEPFQRTKYQKQHHHQQQHQGQTNQFGTTGNTSGKDGMVSSSGVVATVTAGTAAGQFPASFPDSFKDFFAMLNEEDDHVDLFSNILEDKDIPRGAKCRYNRTSNAAGTAVDNGSGRSGYSATVTPHSVTAHGGNRSFGAGFGPPNNNFGRSSSFRMHRSKPSYAGVTEQQQHTPSGGYHPSNQQLLIKNIRNQLGGSGVIAGTGTCGENEDDRTMKNLNLIKSAIVDKSPSSSALGGGLTVTGFPGPASINRSKSNSKIDDRSPNSYEMKSFEYAPGGGSGAPGSGRNYKISENSDEVEEDAISSSGSTKNLTSKLTKTTTSYCFMRHHQQQQQQQQEQQQQQLQQPTTKPPHHARNNSLRVHRSNASSSISPSASILSAFSQGVNKSTIGGSCVSFSSTPGATGFGTANCLTGNCLPLASCSCCPSKEFMQHQKSPVFSRQRSSSISVARPTPDLYRFLKAEVPVQQPLSPGSRFESREKFSALTASITGANLASSTSTLSTLVESISGVSNSAVGASAVINNTQTTHKSSAIDECVGMMADGTGGSINSNNNNNNNSKQQLNFNLGTITKDTTTTTAPGSGNLSSSPSAYRLKYGGGGGGGGGYGSGEAPPTLGSARSDSRFQNGENDVNFNNQHHPAAAAHRTVSISTTAIVCGGRDGSRTPALPGVPGPDDAKQQRMRTSSMPVENRKPRLADTRRSAIHCADVDMEYYRLRSFSITSHGICNLGDSMRSRRSRSINSVTSASSGGKDRKESGASQKHDTHMESADGSGDNLSAVKEKDNAYKVAMLGASGVGKTALTYQFTTSEYICAYDLSLDDDYGQKTVSVLLDGQETDLEIIDHPACEMSEEAFCSTYQIDIFVVVYSVVDRGSFKKAEKILNFLKDSEMLLTRGVILVGNKTDLERQREVPCQVARRLAKEIGAKFIETSSGMDYNVDELLVGIVAQVKLNPQRINRLTDKQRNSIAGSVVPQPKTAIRGRKTAMSMRELSGKDAASRIRRIVRRSSIGKFGSEEDDDYNVDDKRLRKKNHDYRCEDDVESDDERSTDNETNLLRRKRFDLPSISTQTVSGAFGSGRTLKRLSRDQQQHDTDMQQQQQQQPDIRRSPQPGVKRFNYIDEKSAGAGGSSSGSNKFANRTKLLLNSFLKFKRNLRVKRRSSGSCSDLFVI
ncbi:probable serine/threonine-protein kinase yakA [Malaya genurostris]|uniref:probable serine/threonine-protein kinase yakA n=1 Tax=Malaya genurostris TaxID=325434 RepID=UPI0026F4064D|nr:probable serine/threonine-protein kinase yakA [Malaya genurostris]XP_058444115.1 probable serine/threonine-protein kinase yakA [Malaya genurostris]